MNGGHKKLSCGITDITTDKFYAEIKEWSCWKEAFGQLLAYNVSDPKKELAVYFFGTYSQSCKDKVKAIAKQVGYKLYELNDQHGKLHIKSLQDDKEEVFDLSQILKL